MTNRLDDHERTMAFANVALSQIKALHQSAIPRNYDIWYHYATGYNPALNKVLNETLTRNGGLSEADLEHIHEAYLSPTRLSDKVDSVGSHILTEMNQMMATLGVAIGNAHDYGRSLNDACARLPGIENPDSLRTMLGVILSQTQKMRDSNADLEERLTASRAEIEQLQQSLATARSDSLRDALTGLSNRAFFDRSLKETIAETQANRKPLCLLMIDIDHFKSFNDNFGHLTGDQVLRLVGMALKQSVKGRDIAARYGGEEFSIILPETPLRPGITVAEQIRRAVMSKELKKRSTGEVLGRITISVGIAELALHDTPQSLLARADACLYSAKRLGRNRVICETDLELLPVSEMQVA